MNEHAKTQNIHTVIGAVSKQSACFRIKSFVYFEFSVHSHVSTVHRLRSSVHFVYSNSTGYFVYIKTFAEIQNLI